ncbi:hypothetical protein N0V93_002325 [Gnomoniopsis smithogilvyi]|uniref:Protein Zds1 C-terminal domain-containing protein n=1 Tax=Gnomoniopsis smithogilvyi TaxID=1191159 RepID=A0A9W9CYY9_9PEZI|nr:hypothetical protein N0V93_002325 [Gnomoniopsis smithogilvyi]
MGDPVLLTHAANFCKTTSRPRDAGGSFASRRGHANTLSISDPSHHVTEAIGTLYGSDDNDSDSESRENRKSRPLSFLGYENEELPARHGRTDETHGHNPRQPLQRSHTDNTYLSPLDTDSSSTVKKANTVHSSKMSPSQRANSHDNGPLSPALSLRDVQAAEDAMPMTDIVNASDIAQEMSNLQALRRMSMDVGIGNHNDPDLMPFQGIVPIPSIAPTGDDDEADPSRLLWVPANVHPELAPEQFKSFLERRVNSMKRMSGDSMLSSDGLQRSDSFGGLGSLRRTKSKLSRQINTRQGDDYVDGAERLERQRSINGYATPELSLDELVKDPTKAIQTLTQEASEGGGANDVILPVAPGMGLRRSTRTQYRKSGSIRGERPSISKRVGRLAETQEESIPAMPKVEAPAGQGLSRVQTEPVSTENFSRPTKSVRRQQGFTKEAPSPIEPPTEQPSDVASQQIEPQAHARGTSDPDESVQPAEAALPRVDRADPTRQYPERSSSQQKSRDQDLQSPGVPQQQRLEQRTSVRSNKEPPPGRQGITPAPLDNVPGNATQTMRDITQAASIPGTGFSRTDNLTLIPTFTESEKKKGRDSDSESTKSSSGWKWFKSEDKKKKDKDKDREKDEQTKRSKLTKAAEKPHENARLDVLSSAAGNVAAKGRESLLLDRDSVDNKLQEERKKESSRKSSESKKDKDGFFGSIFGSKKKVEKETSSKKQHRPLSPEPPPMRQLKPDVDYPYTRFPILEERAIYRMAHIKLANPKRNLLSQVLLSNFMYSYLGKIQAMNPQIQVPVSPQQKRLEEERRRQQEEQQQAYMEQQMQQHQAQNSIDQYNFEYHRSASQYGDSEGEYVDENGEPYDYDQGHAHGGQSGYDGHGQAHGQNGGGYGYGQHDAYGHHQQGYYDGHDPQRQQDDDDMW